MYSIIALFAATVASAQIAPRADTVTSLWVPGADEMPLVASIISSVCL